MSGFPVSAGQATNTLADTSARHHIVGRLCTAMYQSLVDPKLVITQKHDFQAVQKELALAVGRSYNSELAVSPAIACKGPVPVITNIAPFGSCTDNDLMAWYVKLYDCRSAKEMRNHVNTPCTVKNQTYYPPELYFGGYVMSHNTQAHPINGDTALTLFIGGIITVKNGRFHVKGGDKMQWYFEAEANCDLFEVNTDGMRKPRENIQDVNNILDPTEQTLTRYTRKIRDRQYAERAATKHVVFVKSCRPGINGTGCTVMDKRRVFGIATGDAGPYEWVDIKICRQSH